MTVETDIQFHGNGKFTPVEKFWLVYRLIYLLLLFFLTNTK